MNKQAYIKTDEESRYIKNFIDLRIAVKITLRLDLDEPDRKLQISLAWMARSGYSILLEKKYKILFIKIC